MASISPLTDVDFWQAHQPPIRQLAPGGKAPSWYKHIAQFLPQNQMIGCLEVGVVPGNTLLFFATHLGYSCTGVDYSPRVQDTRAAFVDQGITALFFQVDFNSWKTDEQYDLVYSCGFIEHFTEYQAVIEKHWQLVRPGGLFLLTVPTMTPVQKLLRWMFYQRSKMLEILATHNFRIMSLSSLRKAVKNLSASEILVASYVCELEIWFDANDPGIRQWVRPLYNPIKTMSNLVNKTGISSRLYSPSALILVRKGLETP